MNSMTTALEALRKELADTRHREKVIEDTIRHLEHTLQLVAPADSKVSDEFAGLSIAAAAKRFLMKKGRGATTREIADGLRANGITTTSRNFPMTVYAILRESQGFERTNGGEWTLMS